MGWVGGVRGQQETKGGAPNLKEGPIYGEAGKGRKDVHSSLVHYFTSVQSKQVANQKYKGFR